MSITDLVWKDRVVANPNTFKATSNLSDGTITLERSEGTVTEEGTPLTAENLNMMTASLKDAIFQTAGGTATALTLTINQTLVNGYPITFIAGLSNSGATTTINGKKLYKPGTTTAPTLVANKAYTVWYNSTGDCFFIKTSGEGTALASQVLISTTFTNDNDSGIPGTMPNNGALSASLNCGSSYTIPLGYTSGGTITANSLASQTVASATANQILYGLTAWINGVKVTGTIASKAATTYNPSTSQQTISAGQYLSGDQVIAAITGTATDADVVSGKTYNSAAGILRTGAATIASLGGKYFASGSVTSGTTGSMLWKMVSGSYYTTPYAATVTGLTFTPKFICLFAADGTTITVFNNILSDSMSLPDIKVSSGYTTANTTGSIISYQLDGTVSYVTSTGFQLPVWGSGKAFNWFAIA